MRSKQVLASAGYDIHNVVKVEIEIDFSQFDFSQKAVKARVFFSQYEGNIYNIVKAAIETTVTVVDEVEAVAVEQAHEGFSRKEVHVRGRMHESPFVFSYSCIETFYVAGCQSQ